MEERLLNLSEAGEYLGVSRQAVFVAIKANRIPCEREKGKYRIGQSALDAYKESKYKRRATLMFKGEPISEHTDYMNTEKACEEFGLNRNNLYYSLRTGKIPYEKVGTQFILRRKDIEKFVGALDRIKVG